MGVSPRHPESWQPLAGPRQIATCPWHDFTILHGARASSLAIPHQHPDAPRYHPDNGTERDIRSPAAARSDGGTHRADWSAAAFARLKSVIVTGMKNQVRFIRYGIEVVRAKLRGERLPLPLAAASDTS
jgi:hypothetical protein